MNRFLLSFLFAATSLSYAYAQWENLNGPPVSSVSKVVSEINTGKAYALISSEIYATTNEGATWQEVSTPPFTFVYDILLDGTTLYFSDYYALYKSTDGGINWTRQSDDYNYGLRYIRRVSTNTFIGYDGYYGVKITEDAGVTWSEVFTANEGSLNNAPDQVVANAAGDLYFITNGGLKRHLNPGAGAWSTTNVQVVEATYTVGSLAAQGNNIYFTDGTVFVKSTTGNAGTFASIISNIPDTIFIGYWSLAPNNALYYINNHTKKIYSTSSTDAGSTWAVSTVWPSASFSNANVTTLGFVNSIKFYAGTEGDGIFFTTNTGSSYTTRTSGINKGFLRKIEVTASGRILVLVGNQSFGYWYSDDGGSTWAYQNMGVTLDDIHLTSQNALLLFNSNTVFYSTDNASTWNQVSTTIYSLASKPDGTLYGGSFSGIFRTSADNGATWQDVALTGAIPTSNSYLYDMGIDSNGKIYIMCDVFNGTAWQKQFYKITMSGTLSGSAVLLETPYNGASEDFINIFVNNDKVYLGTNKNLYYSLDEGGLWEKTGIDNRGVFSLAGGIAVANNGSLYITQDDGKTWSSTTLPDANSVVYDIAVDAAGDFLAAADFSPVLKYNDAGGSLIVDPGTLPPYIDFDWQPLDGPYGGPVESLKMDGAGNIYAKSSGRYYKNTTTLTGAWTRLSLNNAQDFSIANDGTNSVFALQNGEIYKSTDAGQTFTRLFQRQWHEYPSLLQQFSDGDIILFGERYNFVANAWQKQFMISTDGGASLEIDPLLVLPSNGYVMNMMVGPGDVFYAKFWNYDTNIATLYKSEDKGQNWTTPTFPSLSVPYSDFTMDHEGNLYVKAQAFTTELFKSSDGGATWNSIVGDFSGGAFYPYLSPAISTTDNALYIQSDAQRIFKSVNGGQNWTELYPDPTFSTQASYLLAVGTDLLLASSDGIKLVTNNGSTVTSKVQGIEQTTFEDIEVSGNNSLLLSNRLSTGKAQISSDFNSFEPVGITDARFYRRSSGSLIAYQNAYPYKFYESFDSGLTWEERSDEYAAPGGLYFADSYDDVTFIFAGSQTLYSTTDFATLNNLNVSGFPSSFAIQSFTAYANGVLFATVRNYQQNKDELYRIEFANAALINIGQNPVSIHSVGNKLILYDRKGAIYESTDGENWSQKGAPSNGSSLQVADNGYYFITNSNSFNSGLLWLSRDSGTTWQNVGIPSSAGSNFTDVVVNPFDGYAYATLSNSVVRKSAGIILPSETTAPTLTSFATLNDGSTRPVLALTFSEAVIPRQGKKIKILDLAAPSVAVFSLDAVDDLASQDGYTFYYELPAGESLSFGKTYFVLIDAPTSGNGTFEDLFSNNYTGINNNATWRFTTRPAPTLVSLSPADGATDVPINTEYVMTFSERMEPVNGGGALTLYKQGGQFVTPLANCNPVPQFASISWYPLLSRNFDELRFEALQGGGELIGAAKVYAHMFAFYHEEGETQVSVKTIGNWGQDNGVGEMLANGTDKWRLPFTPMNYFDLLPEAIIDSIGVVFRSADGNIKATPPAVVQGANVLPNGDVVFSVHNDNTIERKPCANLEFNTTYYVQSVPSSFEVAEGKRVSFVTTTTDWNFTTVAAPGITSLSPANGATEVSLTPQLTINFGRTVETMNPAGVYVFDALSGTTVAQATNVVPSGTGFTFTLSAPLAFGKEYYVQALLNDTFTSQGVPFNPLSNTTTWRFTTETVPVITSISPVKNATGVSMNPTFTFTFDKSVERVYLTEGIVTLSAVNVPGTSVLGSDLTPVGNGFSFTSPIPLEFNKEYTIQFRSMAFSRFGVPFDIVQSTFFQFTTEAAPVVTLLSPTHNATGVSLNPTFSITFDKAVETIPGAARLLYVVEMATGNQQQIEASQLIPSGNNSFNFSFADPLDYNKEYYVYNAGFRAFSRGGVEFVAIGNTTDWRFTTVAQPTVLSTFPAHNAAGVDLENELRVTFSEPVYCTNNATAFLDVELSGGGFSTVPINLTGLETDANNVLVIPLGTLLEFKKQHRVKFSDGAFRTVDMRPFSVLTQSGLWDFTTRDIPTFTVSPVNNATNVPAKPTVSITFSDPVTINAGGQVGFYPVTNPNSAFAFSNDGVQTNPTTISFTLTSTFLNYSTAYYIKAAAQIFDYKGRKFSVLLSNDDWEITTEAAPDSDPPVFGAFTPPEFTKGGSVNNTITVSVTDVGSNVASVTLWHRKMRSTGAFTEENITASKSGNNYSAAVTAAMLDELGLEYYFEATDNSIVPPLNVPNFARHPAAANTYFSSGYKSVGTEEPTVPPTVVGNGGQPDNYRIFSIPYELANPSIATVFDELGSPDPAKYRLLTYDKTKTGNGGWAEYKDDFTSFTRGKGYWLNTIAGATINLEGAKTGAISKTSPFVFNLQPGWNQIGNPYPFQIDWAIVRGGNASVDPLYKFNGGYTSATQTLNAFEGGFVFVKGSTPVTLSVPLVGGSGARTAMADDFSQGWNLPLQLEQGHYKNDFTGIGMHPEADLSSDRFDRVTPPRFIEYLEANVHHPETTGKNFSRDVVPVQSEYTWQFTVESNLEGIATFTWLYPEGNDFARELYLFDVALQRPVDMRTATSYSFNPRESSAFKIYYGENFLHEFAPPTVALGQAYPNPSNSDVNIAFSLPEKGGQTQLVEIEVMDALGRSLGTVAKGQFAPGYHSLRWEGAAQATGNGLLTYRLNVSNTEGKQVLQGKIMIKK